MNWTDAQITVFFEDCQPGKKEAVLRVQINRDGNVAEMRFPIDEWELFGLQAGGDDEKTIKLLLRNLVREQNITSLFDLKQVGEGRVFKL